MFFVFSTLLAMFMSIFSSFVIMLLRCYYFQVFSIYFDFLSIWNFFIDDYHRLRFVYIYFYIVSFYFFKSYLGNFHHFLTAICNEGYIVCYNTLSTWTGINLLYPITICKFFVLLLTFLKISFISLMNSSALSLSSCLTYLSILSLMVFQTVVSYHSYFDKSSVYWIKGCF